MATLTEKLRKTFFKPEEHPYRILEKEIELLLHPDHTILDAGCGRSLELLRKFAPRTKRAIGVDLVEFSQEYAEEHIGLLQGDLNNIKLEDKCVDLVVSRSVFEHLQDPLSALRELNRILKPGGYCVFLTPNSADYATIIARLLPNRIHPWIVARTEGRKEIDTFPTYYRANSCRTIRHLAGGSGFEVAALRYLGQYPSYLMFSPVLFLIGTCYEKLISRFNLLRVFRGWLLVVLRKPQEF